jgi:integrase
MNLTERKIKYLEAGKSRQIVWDNGGFGIQVAPDGEKTFILEYRFNEMTKMITLGIYPEISLGTAKQQAIKAFEMVIQGVDPEEKGLPQPEKGKADDSVDQKQTLDQFKEKASEKLDQFKGKASEQLDKIKSSGTLDKFKEKAAAKLDEIKQRVEKKVTHPQIESKPAENKIIPLDKKARIQQEKPKPLEKKAERPAKKVEIPVKKAEKPAKKAKPAGMKNKFGRILDKNELKTLWSSLENSDMPPVNQVAIKLLIVTAQRYEEVIPARWADFDMVSKWWTIPEDFTRNGEKHRVPLSNLASDLLRKIKELSGMSGVLFPVPGGVTAIDSKTLAEGLQRAQVRFGLKPFTLLDLQNSAVCQMLDNDIPESTLYRLLNQEEPKEFGKEPKKVRDSDLRKALDKLERQLPKSY